MMSDLKSFVESARQIAHKAHDDGEFGLAANCSFAARMAELYADKMDSQPTISDYLKANEAMLTKTKAKMVSIESLKDFAGIK